MSVFDHMDEVARVNAGLIEALQAAGMKAFGQHTGGGCTAVEVYRFAEPGYHILLTDTDASADVDLTQEDTVYVGLYNAEGESMGEILRWQEGPLALAPEADAEVTINGDCVLLNRPPVERIVRVCGLLADLAREHVPQARYMVCRDGVEVAAYVDGADALARALAMKTDEPDALVTVVL